MRTTQVILLRTRKYVCHRAWIAERTLTRLRGLLCRPPLQSGEGLLLPGIRSIHTFGMRYVLDLVYLDAELRVIGLRTEVPPRRTATGPELTSHVLELGCGEIALNGILLGDRLSIPSH